MSLSLTVPTVEHQTGFVRPHPRAICQDTQALKKVFLYDYDASDKDFIQYCRKRGVLNALPITTDPYWTWVTDWRQGFKDFLRLADMRTSEQGQEYTDLELKELWSTTDRARGSLQDAWQLYLDLQKERI